MKKLIVASAAVVAAAFLPGHAFAHPGGAAKAIEAPSAAVKASCGCHHVRHSYRPRGCGYYSSYVYTTPCGGGCGCGGWGGWSYGCGGWGGGIIGAIFGW